MTKEGYKVLGDLKEEYVGDVSITRMNLEEQTFRVPVLKAKWIGQYSHYKHELSILQSNMEVLRAKQMKLDRNRLKVSVSDEELAKMKIKNTDQMRDVEVNISDHIEILEVLGEFKKIISFLGNDVRNVLDYLKLEVL